MPSVRYRYRINKEQFTDFYGGKMMKRLLVMMLVLSMAVVANAGLLITVDGVVDPADSTISLTPSDTVILGIWSDGEGGGGGTFYFGTAGPSSLDASEAVLPLGGTLMTMDDAVLAESLGVQNPFIVMELGDMTGTLVGGLEFHCEGPDDVIVYLMGVDYTIEDTQIIHQVPEPMTIALLGIGGLLLRRKK
jgi:hypothetical protein